MRLQTNDPPKVLNQLGVRGGRKVEEEEVYLLSRGKIQKFLPPPTSITKVRAWKLSARAPPQLRFYDIHLPPSFLGSEVIGRFRFQRT